MKRYKQNPDFLHIGETLIQWYKNNARELPWRTHQSPYHIWISEIILQQTQVQQGLPYYQRFIGRFGNVYELANADQDEVLLYWKGLGYYSRAINLHKAAKQVVDEFHGEFPSTSLELQKLKGVGKYTAAAIASICFNEVVAAVDGNFYRVLARFFGDDFDISNSKSFFYFSDLATRLMPKTNPGDFNQAIMDLGANICTPKLAKCDRCPLNLSCVAYNVGEVYNFPVKLKKTKVENEDLYYFLVKYSNKLLIRKRGTDSIWKNLYEISAKEDSFTKFSIEEVDVVKHKLSHRNLTIHFYNVVVDDESLFIEMANNYGYKIIQSSEIDRYSFPKPIDEFLQKQKELWM